MGCITSTPYVYAEGQAVQPEQLNSNLNHLANQINERQRYRSVYSTVSIPFHKDTSTGYTEATAEEVRTVRLPATISQIDSAQLTYYGTGTGTVTVHLMDDSDGYLLENYLQVTPTSSIGTHTYTQLSQVSFTPGTRYRLVIVGDSFTSRNTWVELRFKEDIYSAQPTGYYPELYQDGDVMVPSEWSGKTSAAQTAIDSIPLEQTANRYQLFLVHDLVYADPAELHTFPLPVVDSAAHDQHLTGRYIVATRGNEAATSTVNARYTVYDSAGSQVLLGNAGMISSSSLASNDTTASEDISAVSPGNDWTVQFTQFNNNTDVVAKVYAWFTYQ